jgi:hypothetical protein
MVTFTALSHCLQKRPLVPSEQEVGWTPEPGLTVVKQRNVFAHTRSQVRWITYKLTYLTLKEPEFCPQVISMCCYDAYNKQMSFT